MLKYLLYVPKAGCIISSLGLALDYIFQMKSHNDMPFSGRETMSRWSFQRITTFVCGFYEPRHCQFHH